MPSKASCCHSGLSGIFLSNSSSNPALRKDSGPIPDEARTSAGMTEDSHFVHKFVYSSELFCIGEVLMHTCRLCFSVQTVAGLRPERIFHISFLMGYNCLTMKENNMHKEKDHDSL